MVLDLRGSRETVVTVGLWRPIRLEPWYEYATKFNVRRSRLNSSNMSHSALYILEMTYHVTWWLYA